MKVLIVNRNIIASIIVIILLIYGLQGLSYAQEANPTITASVEAPLTEVTLSGSVVTLTLSGRSFTDRERDIRDAITISGIDGVSTSRWGVERVSDTKVTVELAFSGNIDADTPLVFTVGAGAIAEYDGAALTAQLPVTAVAETLVASTAAPLTEATLHGSVVTFTLTGRQFVNEWDIKDAVSGSGIEGVTVDTSFFNLERVSDTVVTIPLIFSGNIDEDSIFTITIGADAIAGYNQAFTVQLPVTAVEESLVASTEAPLSEATLHGSIITLTLTGRQFRSSSGLSVSGIDGVVVTTGLFGGIGHVSDTEWIVPLTFSGNIDEDATLTLTVGADAIQGYNKDFTFQFPVTAVEESLEASTEAPLTEATLQGSIITLTLNGRRFVGGFPSWTIEDSVSVSGINGVTVDTSSFSLRRVSDTVLIVPLTFSGNIDEDATLTLTVGADAIQGYNKDFTFQFPVTAVEESLEVSTEAPLTEAMLDGGIITLTLNGRQFDDSEWTIGDAVSVSGIEGLTVPMHFFGVERISDTVATIELNFNGNIDEDATFTLTVGPEAIGYNKPFSFEFSVTAVEESLVASAEGSLTEATLDGSIITFTLSGRRFTDTSWYSYSESTPRVRDSVSVFGIEGVTINDHDVVRISDTEVKVKLTFSGNMDTDGTLTFTVGADAIAGYKQGFTTQLPVTAIQKSDATVSISPSPVVSPNVGEQLTLNLNIAGGENVAGYQMILWFDDSALDYMESGNGDYLPADTFFMDPVGEYTGGGIALTLAAATLAGAGNGDGTLATLTFDVIGFKASKLTLSKVYLVDTTGKRWETDIVNGEITEPPEPAEPILGDINSDGVVNIQDLVLVGTHLGQRGQNSADVNGDGLVDIVDVVLVASAFNEDAAAPPLNPQALELITTADVRQWLNQAQRQPLTNPTFQRGIRFLEQLLTVLSPKETILLPNYPNPFNPETWIPYRLTEDAFVTLTIFDGSGQIVRTLEVGHRVPAFYESRAKAIHWDAKNGLGEQVASGVYFYHLSAGDFSATRKMLIIK